ncbi:hypothetical protein AC578_5975 [Pseudocercospora eumusae]|uniref:Uncharacterized protein n=1 Tax=Pseudocercospora eumusae TaxID=321146 RepID=A0A139HI71_9PEZI|nr:hypothetical protein AC578_5975 [Pseudocercospora eumusae]
MRADCSKSTALSANVNQQYDVPHRTPMCVGGRPGAALRLVSRRQVFGQRLLSPLVSPRGAPKDYIAGSAAMYLPWRPLQALAYVAQVIATKDMAILHKLAQSISFAGAMLFLNPLECSTAGRQAIM